MMRFFEKTGRLFLMALATLLDVVLMIFGAPFAIMGALATYRMRKNFSPGSIVRVLQDDVCCAGGQEEYRYVNDLLWGRWFEKNHRRMHEGSTMIILRSKFRGAFDHAKNDWATFEFLLGGVLCSYKCSCKTLLTRFEIVSESSINDEG